MRHTLVPPSIRQALALVAGMPSGPAPRGEDDGRRLEAWALRHGLLPVLAACAGGRPLPGDLSRLFKERPELLADAAALEVIPRTWAGMREVLDAAGIPYLPLKGAAVGLAEPGRWYPDTLARPMRDLDLLVDRRGVPALLEALARAGYAFLDLRRLSHHVVAVRAGEAPVEFHHAWPPGRRPVDLDELIRRGWATKTGRGAELRGSPALHVVVAAVSAFLNEDRAALQACDALRLHAAVDGAQVAAIARHLGAAARVRAFEQALAALLDADGEAAPPRPRARILLRAMLSAAPLSWTGRALLRLAMHEGLADRLAFAWFRFTAGSGLFDRTWPAPTIPAP